MESGCCNTDHHTMFARCVFYQNLQSRFGIERHAYTKSRIEQFRVYVCVCNYSSQTTEPICIKIIPANRVSYADCYRLLRFEIFTKYDKYCPRERCCTGVFLPVTAYSVYR